MKFDPRYFIQIANRSGVELTLNPEGRILFVSSGTNADVLWLTAAKKHKRKLASHLRAEQGKRKQTDLFDTPR